MRQQDLDEIAARINAASPSDIRQARGGGGEDRFSTAAPYALMGSVGVIQIVGSLWRSDSDLARYIGGTNYVSIAEKVQKAVDDPKCDTILLRFDSGGGQVSGVHDLAATIRSAARVKRVVAHADDTCCSAALLLACSAHQIYGAPGCVVGSIGTLWLFTDFSEALNRGGVRVHAITSGKLKGMGMPALPFNDDYRQESQRLVDTFAGTFIGEVALGRHMNEAQVRSLADGRVWVGPEAQRAGMIDGIMQFQALLSSLDSGSGATVPRTSTDDDEESTERRRRASTNRGNDLAARQRELLISYQAQLPNSTATQRLEWAERGLSAQQAAAELSTPTGRGAVPTAAAAGGAIEPTAEQVIAKFESRVQAKVDEGLSRQDAIMKVARQDPTLHARFIRATNPNVPTSHLPPLPATRTAVAQPPEPTGQAAVAEFNEAVGQLTAGGLSKLDAVAHVQRRRPQLHHNYLVATNPHLGPDLRPKR